MEVRNRPGCQGPVVSFSWPSSGSYASNTAHLHVVHRAVLARLSLRSIALRRVAIRGDLEQCLPSRVRHTHARDRDCRLAISLHVLRIVPSGSLLQRVWSRTNSGAPSLLLTLPMIATSAPQ